MRAPAAKCVRALGLSVLSLLALLGAGLALVTAARPATAAPGALVLERRITAPTPQTSAKFARLVALDGDLLAVLDGGVVRLHQRGAGTWLSQRSITLPANTIPSSMDLDGTTLVLGVLDKSQALVFDLTNAAAAPLVLTLPLSHVGFGSQVALDGDRLIVTDSGEKRAHVFHRVGPSWGLAPGGTLGPPAGTTPVGGFPHSVDLAGDRAVVSDARSVYVYRWTGATWTFDQQVTSPGNEQLDSETGALLGADTLVLSVNQGIVGDSRRVHFYQRTSSWSLVQSVTLPARIDEAALDGTNLAVLDEAGKVHQYAREGAAWLAGPPMQVTETPAGFAIPTPVVDVSGSRIVVGGPGEAPGGVVNAGAAYVLVRSVVQAPGAPTGVTAVPGPSHSTASVQWQPPVSDGGAALVQYSVRAIPQDGADIGAERVVPSTATTTTFSSLSEFGQYHFTVTARNVVGDGSPSAPSNLVTVPGRPAVPSPFAQTDPGGDTDDPAGDILETSVDYVDGFITVGVRTAAPEDPHTSPWWRNGQEANWMYFRFAPPAQQHLMVFQHESTNASPFHLPGHDVIARFEFDDSCGRPVFPGEFVDGWFRTTFPASCLGSPSAVRFAATVPLVGDQAVLTPPVLPRSTGPALPPGQGGGGGGVVASPEFVGRSPERLLDTGRGSRPGPGSTVELAVAGRAGVPGDAVAAVLNVTGTEAVAEGFVTAWPCGQPRPLASNLNLSVGASTPNLVIVPLGAGGKVCLFSQSGAHLIADVFGWFPAGSSFAGISPQRLLDTRSGARPGAGSTVELAVAGRAGVPGDAVAAVLNVTGTEAVAEGFVTAWPCGQPRPLASNLNLSVGASTPNLVIVPLGAGGKVCLFSQSGAHLIADVFGWFPAGSSFAGISPQRLLDTRSGARPGAGSTVELAVAGRAGVPGDAVAAVLNVTGTEAVAEGFVTAWPCGQPRPLASNLNLSVGASTPNLVIVPLGAGGKVCLFSQSGAHLIADVFGWFPA